MWKQTCKTNANKLNLYMYIIDFIFYLNISAQHFSLFGIMKFLWSMYVIWCEFAGPSRHICQILRTLLAVFYRLTWTWALWWARSEFVPAPVGSSRARRSRPGSPLWCTGAWRTATRRDEGERKRERVRRRDVAQCGEGADGLVSNSLQLGCP